MQQDLIFDGKKYISSKRASQISAYSKDYIGQMCREGRIDGRIVGRSWYVEEKSLLDHLKIQYENENFETAKKLSPFKIQALIKVFSGSISAGRRIPIKKGDVMPGYVSVKKASQISTYTSDYIGQLCRENKILSRMIGRNWYIEEKSLLEYLSGQYGSNIKSGGKLSPYKAHALSNVIGDAFIVKPIPIKIVSTGISDLKSNIFARIIGNTLLRKYSSIKFTIACLAVVIIISVGFIANNYRSHFFANTSSYKQISTTEIGVTANAMLTLTGTLISLREIFIETVSSVGHYVSLAFQSEQEKISLRSPLPVQKTALKASYPQSAYK